jgi:26S proteasome regulatory subunit T4
MAFSPLMVLLVIVKASSGPRYVVGCRSRVNKAKLTPSTRVALDMTTLTIMRILPREVDPVVFHMRAEDPGKVSYSAIGGLSDQIRELREVGHRSNYAIKQEIRLLNYH